MSNEQDIPLLSMEPPSSLRPRPKKSKLTPCRFCLGLFLLAVGSFLSILAYQLSKIAVDALGEARYPHLAFHHPKNETAMGLGAVGEQDLVRSFYGRQEDGGVVDKFDLVATIYHRVVVWNGTVVGVREGLEEDRKNGLEEGDEEGEEVWGPFERIFSEVVMEGLSLKAKGVKTVAKVVLPGRIM